MRGSGMNFGFFAALVFGFECSVCFEAVGEEEHVAMIDWYVSCDPDSFFATSGTFSKSLLMSRSGMVVT